MQAFNFQPVIIIGAGRSGTNMVRDLLTAFPACATWPCDEINYIWRYGNAGFPTDELTAEHARPNVVRYIRRQFERCAARAGAQWIVEKTCANSLRVDFVRKVVPEAKYIHLVRDGWDVASSAEKRWRAPLDLRYVLKKAAYVPVRDMPYYALRYAGHRLRKLTHRESRLPTWGPKCGKLSQWCAELSTQEVCLRQWSACVERATDSLGRVPRQQVHFVRYENLVTQPLLEMSRMCNFLGIHPQQTMLTALTKTLYCDSVGKGIPTDPTGNRQVLTDLVRDTLDRVHRMWPDERLGSSRAA